MNLGRLHILLPILAILLGTAHAAKAQEKTEKTSEKVRFKTVDGVELHGNFYNSNKRSSPTVLLLHAVGGTESSLKKGWVSLAEQLQSKGFCVLSFDFRGHGNSTDVDPEVFWRNPRNQSQVKGVGKSTIESKNFSAGYYPVLVNDIAAAKAFLDRSKNDNGVCNTSSFVLIGGETGATLGAIWLNSEWHRFKMNQPNMFGMPAMPDTRPEGKDTVCAIWLSMSSKLPGNVHRITPSAQLALPGKVGATPMVFMYSEQDTAGKSIAMSCESNLKTKDKKYEFTLAFKIKGSKLTGAGLLQKSLGTEEAIVDYLGQVMDAKSNEWVERDFRKAHYIWRSPGNPMLLLPAKPTNDQNFIFDSYEKFIR